MCRPNQSKLCGIDNCQMCFDRSFASHPRAMNWSDVNNILPHEVFRKSKKKYKFKCDKCFHEFDGIISHITDNTWCPYCANQKLCNDNDNCMDCYNKSFMSHERSEYWSAKNIITPRDIFLNTHGKYWFNCNKCLHEFDIKLSDVNLKDKWCPYCSGKRICGECEPCINKSFAVNGRAVYWSIKNKLSPRHVFSNSAQLFTFDCPCGHEFSTKLSYITSKDSWCPYCSPGTSKLCADTHCDFCYNKSFSSVDKSKYWSANNNLTPREVCKGSQTKFMFTCAQGHKFTKSPGKVCSGRWCPLCVNKTETILLNALREHGYFVEYQVKRDWCVNAQTGYKLPYDFMINQYKLIIELDGRQHFDQVLNWDPPEKTQATDKFKMGRANENGYTIIRLLQEDVLRNNYNWWNTLENHLYIHEVPARIYLSRGNEYNCYL